MVGRDHSPTSLAALQWVSRSEVYLVTALGLAGTQVLIEFSFDFQPLDVTGLRPAVMSKGNPTKLPDPWYHRCGCQVYTFERNEGSLQMDVMSPYTP